MKKNYPSTLLCLFLLILIGCAKRTVPATSNRSTVEHRKDTSSVSDKITAIPERTAEVKETVAPKPKAPEYPKIITVNDAAAVKTVDGRMYYDVQGKRYWKNFKDGKYYLFDKSMYENPDFKPGGGNG